MMSKHARQKPEELPEWLEDLRLRIERESPPKQAFLRRAVAAVLRLSVLSEESLVEAATAPTDLAALVRALSAPELLEDPEWV